MSHDLNVTSKTGWGMGYIHVIPTLRDPGSLPGRIKTPVGCPDPSQAIQIKNVIEEFGVSPYALRVGLE